MKFDLKSQPPHIRQMVKLMTATKKKCCCNCVHDIRVKDEQDRVHHNECEIDGHWIGYIACFELRCDHWKEDENDR